MSVSAPTLLSRLMVRARVRHIQVFLSIAELGSTRRAAEAVHLSQPSITHTLAELERLMECQLFLRHPRGMTPTPVAMAILPAARRILNALADSAELVTAMTTSARSSVRLLAIHSAVAGILTRVLPVFSQRHPDVLVQIDEVSNMNRIGEFALSRDLDLVLCRRPPILPEGWVFEPLVADRLVAAVAPTHPLAFRKRIGLKSLWEETWLLNPVESAPRQAFDEMTSKAGVRPSTRLVLTRSAHLLSSMLHHEPLVALAPLHFFAPLLDTHQLVLLKVQIPLALDPIGLLVAEDGGSEVTAQLCNFLRVFADKHLQSASAPRSGMGT